MTENFILDFIKDYNNPELEIKIDGDIINFIKNKKTYKMKITLNDDNLVLNKIDNELQNSHFVEILLKQNFNTINQLFDLLEFICNLNINNYCIICKQKLDFQSDDFVPCGEIDCLHKFEEIIVGDRIIQKINDDIDISKFLIESALDAIQCERKFDIFEPFPTHFLTKDVNIQRGTISKLSGKNYDCFKDFQRINNLLLNFNLDKFIGIAIDCKSDLELSNKIGKDLYILIRFILMSCKVDIQKNDDMIDLKSDKFKIYKIIHPFDKEEEFKKINDPKSYLFHGSRWCNWYSILRNGLKNCSHTKLMTAGAAYGNGIYLSSDVNVSFGYGMSSSKSVIGVFEICNKDKYSKGPSIYVVDDEKVLIQRYLLILPATNRHKNDFISEINNIFNKKIHAEKINMNIKYNKKSIAKIIREYKQLIATDPNQSRFRIEVDPSFPFQWKVFITKFDDKYEIAQDMKKFNIKEIELEVRFPENYPFSPPFIRVVSPRFMHLTGRITSGGSLCLEILTEKGWLPTCNIESLITIIISEIIEGGGRIDPIKFQIPYGYSEAKESFIRVGTSHGWV